MIHHFKNILGQEDEFLVKSGQRNRTYVDSLRRSEVNETVPFFIFPLCALAKVSSITYFTQLFIYVCLDFGISSET